MSNDARPYLFPGSVSRESLAIGERRQGEASCRDNQPRIASLPLCCREGCAVEVAAPHPESRDPRAISPSGVVALFDVELTEGEHARRLPALPLGLS